MAKIIDFKTGKVLADLPTTHASSRRAMAFKLDNTHVLKVTGIISENGKDAYDIVKHIEQIVYKKAS